MDGHKHIMRVLSIPVLKIDKKRSYSKTFFSAKLNSFEYKTVDFPHYTSFSQYYISRGPLPIQATLETGKVIYA